MSAIFIVLILVILVMIFVFFEVMVTIESVGYNPSKLISDIFKKKTDGIELRDKVKANDIESVNKEMVKVDEIESNYEVKVNETIQRWRLAAGILFSLVMVFLLFFYRPSFMMSMGSFYPWMKYAFWPLLFVTIIVFIILSKKEKEFNK